jgi:glutathione S-transferase
MQHWAAQSMPLFVGAAMKLYYSPGACSLSPHIVLLEADIDFSKERVDLQTHLTASGVPLGQVHGKNYVPVLELDDGQRLTEGAAMVQYIADLRPDAALLPPPGTLQRYRVQEWLNFIASELHKAFIPLFRRDAISADWRQTCSDRLTRHLGWVAECLRDTPWLVERFGVADAYLFTILNWSSHAGMELAQWPVLQQYAARVSARPAVRRAMAAEGLIARA